jgi:hypothetical protein
LFDVRPSGLFSSFKWPGSEVSQPIALADIWIALNRDFAGETRTATALGDNRDRKIPRFGWGSGIR